jgi:hypothetical protein
MKKIVGAVALAAMCAGLNGQAFAGDRGSMEDQLACTPDVYRFCSRFIPDEDAIVGCLQRNVQNLSSACHRVFTAPPSQSNNDDDQ